ncbi:hypothetical protein QWJ34_23780 [Saccharibacillus sp. CPCC 101409]|uniref:hypothetical protein n=1 Tax=Saccharibacillus sp. CPCC 101409 TaxID=3058041 RepID=UPI00267390A4|nr:hypothetical protein [Saccharibacillus sp. CPCC 101409]MDO3412808.1 hypothetical protein [Saccharibacillus sp. CPCC 101409]
MGKPERTKRQKRKFIAGLLSAVVPGSGHLYLGLIQKGISFILTILLVVEALLYFSATGIRINVPLLILLGLLIPVIYFYSLYDVLQATDRVNDRRRAMESEFRDWRKSMIFALILIGEGAALLLLHSRPLWLRHLIEQRGREGAALGLVLLGLILGAFQAAAMRRASAQFHAARAARAASEAEGREESHDS